MNKYQTAKLDSLKLIVKESKTNPESMALVPKFSVIVNRVDEICSEIETKLIQQGKDLTGITTDKDFAHETVTDSSVEIAGALFSYAHDRNNHAMMARVNYKSTHLENMTQAELIAAAGIILEEALMVPVADLANEGITAEELETYKNSITYFSEIKSSKREAVIDRSGTTEKLNILFNEANVLVKDKLDRLAIQFKREDPEFYLRYKAARAVHYRSAPKKEPGTETPQAI